jgi:hypothetical protein
MSRLEIVRRLNTFDWDGILTVPPWTPEHPPAPTYVDVLRLDDKRPSAPPYEHIHQASGTTKKHVLMFLFDPTWPWLVDIEQGESGKWVDHNVWVWRPHRDPCAYRKEMPPDPDAEYSGMYKGWPWPYLSWTLRNVVNMPFPNPWYWTLRHTFVGLESVPPELFGIEFSTDDLIAHDRGVEAWGPVLRRRVLEMIRAVDEEERRMRSNHAWDSESEEQPTVAHLTTVLRDHYADLGIDPENDPHDISKRIRVLTMDEYRAEVGDEVWRAETWGEDIPEPMYIPWQDDNW